MTKNGLDIQTTSTKRTDFQTDRVLLLRQVTKKKEKAHKVDFMGHVSKEDKDIYGHLWVVKKD